MRTCFLYPHPPPNSVAAPSRLQDSGLSRVIPSSVHPPCPSHVRLLCATENLRLSERRRTDHTLKAVENSITSQASGGVLPDADEDDTEVCPVDCVREFKTDEEFSKILEKAKESNSLVVVDFFRTSCGSCKYIEQGFAKLCKGSGDQDAAGVVFLKHNVIDEYDEQSEVAERLRIKAVPLFHFYKDGVLLEAFPTRDKERILAAIGKYTSQA